MRRSAGVAVLLAAMACAGPVRGAAAMPGPRVPILMYHHVSAAPARARHPALWVSGALFSRQVRALARAGYHGVTLDDVWRAWHGGAALPPRPIVLTFDDGYASQYRRAAPVLREQGWPGVLNLELSNLHVAGGLTAAEVRRLLAAGWELDAHSLTHPDLTTVDATRLTSEVAGSRAAIQSQFGVPADFFCYPYGRFDADVLAAVRAAGYLGATTTRPGLAGPHGDALALDRIEVDGRRPPRALVAALRAAAAGG